MGTFSRPGAVVGVDLAGEISKGLSSVEKAGRDKLALVNKFQKEALDEKRKQQDLIDQLEDIDEKKPINSMLEEFSNRVDEAYNMKLKSFGGDMSEYDKYYQDTQKVLGDITTVTGLLDESMESFSKLSPQEKNKTILRSSFAGEDKEKRQKYRELLENPDRMGYKFKGNKIIITLDGEELFNGTEYMNLRNKGYELLPKADDYTEELKSVDAKAYENLSNLKTIQNIETKEANTITSEEIVKFEEAKEEYRRRLNSEENAELQALVNESNFQRFITGEEVYDVKKHGSDTKEAIVDYLVKQRFAGATSKINQKQDYLTKAQEEAIRQRGEQIDISRSKLNLAEKKRLDDLRAEKIKQEQAEKASQIPSSGASLVSRLEKDITAAINSPTGGEEVIKDIIQKELVGKIPVKDINFDGKDLKIIETKPKKYRAYTKKQAEEINSREGLEGIKVIGDDGSVIDQEALDALGNIPNPEGNVVEQPAKSIDIKNWRSPSGKVQVLRLLLRKSDLSAKEKASFNEVISSIEKTDQGLIDEKERLDKAKSQAVEVNKAFNSQFEKIITVGTQGSTFDKTSPTGVEVMKLINKLPDDYEIDGVKPIDEVDTGSNREIYNIISKILDNIEKNPLDDMYKNIDLGKISFATIQKQQDTNKEKLKNKDKVKKSDSL